MNHKSNFCYLYLRRTLLKERIRSIINFHYKTNYTWFLHILLYVWIVCKNKRNVPILFTFSKYHWKFINLNAIIFYAWMKRSDQNMFYVIATNIFYLIYMIFKVLIQLKERFLIKRTFNCRFAYCSLSMESSSYLNSL